jgi:hypothetical protein
MKKINSHKYLLFIAILFIKTSCSKDDNYSKNNSATPIKSELSNNPKHNIHASEDYIVILPSDSTWLSRSYTNTGNINLDYSFVWKKISGPSTFVLENPNLLSTKVNKLSKGIYEFELTITDKKGITQKDTAKVIVSEMPLTPKEINFKDMVWICPMGCSLEIKNIYTLIPNESVFKVYIQIKSADWIEAIHPSQRLENSNYSYRLYDGSLQIYSDTNDHTQNIKILY